MDLSGGYDETLTAKKPVTTHKETGHAFDSCRKISMSLIDHEKGERKADACDIWFRQLISLRSASGSPTFRFSALSFYQPVIRQNGHAIREIEGHLRNRVRPVITGQGSVQFIVVNNHLRERDGRRFCESPMFDIFNRRFL